MSWKPRIRTYPWHSGILERGINQKSDQANMQNIEKIHKFPIWMENALTCLFLRVIFSYLERFLVRSETFISEHGSDPACFQVLFLLRFDNQCNSVVSGSVDPVRETKTIKLSAQHFTDIPSRWEILIQNGIDEYTNKGFLISWCLRMEQNDEYFLWFSSVVTPLSEERKLHVSKHGRHQMYYR